MLRSVWLKHAFYTDVNRELCEADQKAITGRLMKTSLPVIRLLNLLRAVRELSPFDALAADEEQLLNDIILRWHVQDRLTIKEVMDDIRYPSRTTAYRRLVQLRNKGMITLDTADHDGRIKYVCPTEASLSYVASLEAGIEQLARGQ